MLGLTFSSKSDWGSCIVSIAKTASRKIRALIRSMKLLSPEVALYLYKSTIRPWMEYCCHVWAGAPSCYWELPVQKQICRTVSPSRAASLEPLAHRRYVASISLFYGYYFARCSSERAQLVPLPSSRGKCTHCQALSGDLQHAYGKMNAKILLGERWCAMFIFLFLNFYL